MCIRDSPVGESEPKKTELLEREIPKQTLYTLGGPVLMVIEDDIDTKVIKKLQENDLACSETKE